VRASAAPVVAMSPRDIQARIRSGSTAAEVAAASGMPLEKVERYEGPVLAEREYVAQQARKVEVASPAPGHDIYRSAFGDNPATLGDMVAHRLTAHGIASSTLEWDSWRRPDGTWTVVARFEIQPGGHASIGEEPPAMWTFNPSRKSLQNANRWAQQLSELEPLDGPVPARRLSAVSDRPFDFETDAEATARKGADQHGAEQQKEADGLLDMLRSRRGQRLGLDEDSDEALALLLTNGVPAAHPRPAEVPAASEAETEEPEDQATETEAPDSPAAEFGPLMRRREGRPTMLSRLSLAPQHQEPADDSLKLHDGVSTDTREITIVPSPLRPVGNAGREGTAGLAAGEKPVNRPADHSDRPAAGNAGLDELLGRGTTRRRPDTGRAATDAGAPMRQDDSRPDKSRQDQARQDPDRDRDEPERQPSRPKRSSVPSWDEIVFGTRGD
jgi:hypothetical protein